jgi:superfamily II DNA/RNA helicase
MSFDELGLSPEVLRAIAEVGYREPTPIQAQAIPIVQMGRDVLGCAPTGTGKTASFTLPMIDILARGRARARMPRSLILEPTRELATQVAENFDIYGKYHKLSHALLIGGESFVDQQKKLDRGVDVLIATPGRLLDLFDRGKILMSDVKILVIDEADRMLDMGFIPDVEKIVSLLPKIRQTLFFSATMPPEIKRLADAFLMNPKEISVAPPASPAATVTQGMVVVAEEDKREALRRLLRSEPVKNALIFCNRKKDVDILYRSLTKHGFDAGQLHGDMSQPKRTETLERFKNDEIALLVCSDVAARGIDIQGLSHVFNFDVPIHAEDYVHRIGRTGRAGREGHAYTIASSYDGRFVEAIEKMIGKPIPRVEVEGFEPLPFEADADGGRRRGRRTSSGRASSRRSAEGEKRSRGGRGRGERKRAEPQPVDENPVVAAAPEPAEPVLREENEPAETVARDERPAREARSGRGKRQSRPASGESRSKPEPIRHDGSHMNARSDRRRAENDEEEDVPVLAFGDHMPAFLRHPVKRPSSRSERDDERDVA